MAKVLIRNISDVLLDAHRPRTKASVRLEQELADIIENAAPYSPEERLAAAERSQALTPPAIRSDPLELIRPDRSR